jgi:ADP-ribosylglycohydrolase
VNYAERVYAGVLGKIIGVYSGRPFEQWTHERILSELGEVDRYLADELNAPLIVSDDDISGTFTFLRAIADHCDSWDVTPAEIGETWLNYLIEGQNVLWWGGIGTSTEHTAFLRLKEGIEAPHSGSIQLNGRTVAEQIGGQIFIEGWGMIHPGHPVAAVDFSQRAASVSHDGEGVFGGQVIAALVAQAFVEKDILKMIEAAVSFIPEDSILATMITEIRSWHASGISWVAAFQKLKEKYGYDCYRGGCHIVPNHGVVILALLFGGGDFSRSLMICNTCGWDTDCNSANVGCILGILNGLEGIDSGYDWRGPVRDRMYLPTADGGRCVSDAVIEALEIVRVAHTIRGLCYEKPKEGARFSFAFPGALQGFEGSGLNIVHEQGSLKLLLEGGLGSALTPTFPPAKARRAEGYRMSCSPSLSPGQIVRAKLGGASKPVELRIQIETLCGDDVPRSVFSDRTELESGEIKTLEFRVPSLGGYPVTHVGIEVMGEAGSTVSLEWLTWSGSPAVSLGNMEQGVACKDAWVQAVDAVHVWGDGPQLVQNHGEGIFLYGCREWRDYSVETELTPVVANEFGVAVRVQGLRRYYGLRLIRSGDEKCGKAQIVKRRGEISVLAETEFDWEFEIPARFRLSVEGSRIFGQINTSVTLEAVDETKPLTEGAVAIVLNTGRIGFKQFSILPI